MKLIPRGDRLLVKLIRKTEHNIGGVMIALPENARQRPDKAVVLAVGDGRRPLPIDGLATEGQPEFDLSVGDVVLVSRYGGIEVEVDGEQGSFLVIRDSDVIALIEFDSDLERQNAGLVVESEFPPIALAE